LAETVEQAQRAALLPAGLPASEVARFLWATALGITVPHMNGSFDALDIDDTPTRRPGGGGANQGRVAVAFAHADDEQFLATALFRRDSTQASTSLSLAVSFS
jgi:hypothetical protein